MGVLNKINIEDTDYDLQDVRVDDLLPKVNNLNTSVENLVDEVDALHEEIDNIEIVGGTGKNGYSIYELKYIMLVNGDGTAIASISDVKISDSRSLQVGDFVLYTDATGTETILYNVIQIGVLEISSYAIKLQQLAMYKGTKGNGIKTISIEEVI